MPTGAIEQPAGVAAIIIVAVLIMVFLPVIVALTERRVVLVVLAGLLSLVALAIAAVGLLGMSTSGGAIVGMAILYATTASASFLWLVALALGLVSSLDAMTERRERMTRKRTAAISSANPRP